MGHLNLELQNEVSAVVVVQQGAQRVVIVNGHALSNEDFLGLGADHLVGRVLNHFAIKRFKSNGLGHKSISKRDLVSIDQVVDISSEFQVVNTSNRHHEIALSLEGGVVTPSLEAHLVSITHAG